MHARCHRRLQDIAQRDAGAQMVQRPVSGVHGDLSIYSEPLGADGPWHAYGTSTDSWIVATMQRRQDIVFP